MNDKSSASPIRFVIIGGVAAGASAAARARRLDENARITLIERGPDVSFANCGLPYHIGGEIPDRAALAVQTPQTLQGLLNLDVLTSTEAVSIDRAGKAVEILRRKDGSTSWLRYDKLLLAPGAAPLRPTLPGIDDARIVTLRSMQDMDHLKAAAETAQRITVIGAGFIGLEMAEQLVHLGKDVTLVEMLDQVLPPLDRPMTLLLEDELRRHGVDLILGDAIAGFDCGPSITCRLKSDRLLEADLVVLSIGVRPDTALARDAGLTLGPRGHIHVNEFMQTSDPDIYAAGDAVEISDLVTGDPVAVPLGGPANRQGRLAADHIFRPDRTVPYSGALGTAIVRVFEAAAGITGWSEKRLKAAGRDYRTVTVNDNHHASYFSGRPAHPAQDPLGRRFGSAARRPGGGLCGRRQADRRSRHGHRRSAHDRRPGAARTGLCAAFRRRQGHHQPGRIHRLQPARRSARSGRDPSFRPEHPGARRASASPRPGPSRAPSLRDQHSPGRASAEGRRNGPFQAGRHGLRPWQDGLFRGPRPQPARLQRESPDRRAAGTLRSAFPGQTTHPVVPSAGTAQTLLVGQLSIYRPRRPHTRSPHPATPRRHPPAIDRNRGGHPHHRADPRSPGVKTRFRPVAGPGTFDLDGLDESLYPLLSFLIPTSRSLTHPSSEPWRENDATEPPPQRTPRNALPQSCLP